MAGLIDEKFIDVTLLDYKAIEFMAKSGVSYQVWKETEPELTNLFERNFDGKNTLLNNVILAINVLISLTGEQYCTVVRLELPGK